MFRRGCKKGLTSYLLSLESRNRKNRKSGQFWKQILLFRVLSDTGNAHVAVTVIIRAAAACAFADRVVAGHATAFRNPRMTVLLLS
ncbi:hypothetical protein V6N11_066844 [Hibiscus sabdariffa]|uniref:Uncharacterized protein n=1 Tax=Hibiscus sabdariffa TaxID=183260 RepID=A0ABR2SP23_9ROSI